ncbi:hypothetical protein M5K25_014744 [Dendrobium thyrsiflorum]|uniref:Uncharacterized protein n=1 Tax=Dendrobium thyrsiflorum TaxID=117978 RepID=A0ABD0UP45_DENTH
MAFILHSLFFFGSIGLADVRVSFANVDGGQLIKEFLFKLLDCFGQIGQGRLDIPETMDNTLIWGRSALDSDYISFGPIQSIREKSNLISAAKDARLVPSSSRYGSPSQFGKDYSTGSTSSQKPYSVNEVNYGRPSLQISENGDSKQSLLDIPPILGQSSELAWKILEKLDKFVLSPEEKSNMKHK